MVNRFYIRYSSSKGNSLVRSESATGDWPRYFARPVCCEGYEFIKIKGIWCEATRLYYG